MYRYKDKFYYEVEVEGTEYLVEGNVIDDYSEDAIIDGDAFDNSVKESIIDDSYNNGVFEDHIEYQLKAYLTGYEEKLAALVKKGQVFKKEDTYSEEYKA